MLGPGGELVAPQSSPTNSSISSSDLDTQSTGSFFHDRSTSLGTLMGVTFPTITFRAPPHNADSPSATPTAVETSRRAVKSKRNAADFVVAKRRRKWWRFCSDGDSRSASLGEFLEVERRFGDAAFYGAAAELEGLVVDSPEQRNSGRALFADGRILPPSVVDERSSTAGSICGRFPVSITGICSSGAG
ncbi:unnamed protein product [Vicia faba]|uniref:Uncharacterized protein n=1 Tax=Vicia faba TaxID=3906 RepID=A0AAV1BC54_VICFA|nr:unnamed protein product [Vicia faba]